MTMKIKTMSVSETTDALNEEFKKLGWNTWPNGTVVSSNVCSYPNNGGWPDLKTFQKKRMQALKNHPKERAEIIPNGIRITGTKYYALRTIQEITFE